MANLYQLLMWPFRSEFSLFLTLSSLSLIFGIFESLLYSDTYDYSDPPEDSTAFLNYTDGNLGVNTGVLESKSVFFLSISFLSIGFFLLTKIIYFTFFGSLSDGEHAHLSRMLFRFVILRCLILSGHLNVSNHSVFGWIVWFSALGILHSLTLIATVRCNHLSTTSRVSLGEWFRLFATIIFLFISNGCLLICGVINRHMLTDFGSSSEVPVDSAQTRSVNAVRPPTALGVLIAKVINLKDSDLGTIDVLICVVSEVVLLFCLTSHLLGGLMIQAYDRWNLASGRSWSRQSLFSYYVDLIHVVLYHIFEIVHYSHLLIWSRLFSVANLIVFLFLRRAYSVLASKIRRHMSYRRLSKYIADNFSLGTAQNHENVNDGTFKDKHTNRADFGCDERDTEASSDNDQRTLEVCAICWEPMLTWRRLPCRHDFHESCLRSWLEQNPTCPTCRRDLSIPSVILSAVRTVQPDQLALGLFLRNFVRNVDAQVNAQPPVQNVLGGRPANQPTQSTNTTGSPNPTNTRNLFAAAVGLNVGVSFGDAPIVTAAAQAAARDALPSASYSSSGSSDNSSGRGVSPVPSDQNEDVSPQSPRGNLVMPDENDQIRRRTFHFDGSRYFSWLPSLHVELSEVIREVFAGGTREPPPTTIATPRIIGQQRTELPSASSVTDSTYNPNSYELIRLPRRLRAPATEIAAMFPQFSLSDIVADLLMTGVPEATVENLVQRPTPSVSTESTSRASVLPSNRPSLSPMQTPPETTVSAAHTHQSLSLSRSPENRMGSSFHQRRQAMLDAARRRFLANTDVP